MATSGSEVTVRRLVAAATVTLVVGSVAGCSASPHQSGSERPARAGSQGVLGTTSTTASSTIPPSTPTAPATTSPGARPTLGLLTGLFAQSGAGFGQVEPKRVFIGGDPTGDVEQIVWSSWGAPQAIGTGVSDYVGAGQSVAGGTEQAVHIVAFDLGICNGTYMYQAVEWYFPQHGQSFDPDDFEDICTGQYYPPETGSYEDGGNDGGQGVAHYVITLEGSPAALSGTLQFATAAGDTSEVSGLTGAAGLDGGLTLRSTGPTDPGAVYTGTWATGDITLDDCDRNLSSPPGTPVMSCTFAVSSIR